MKEKSLNMNKKESLKKFLQRKNSYKNPFQFTRVCIYASMCVHAQRGQERLLIPVAGAADGCELPNVGAGNQTPNFRQSSKSS